MRLDTGLQSLQGGFVPEGLDESSPAVYCWVNGVQDTFVPSGTIETLGPSTRRQTSIVPCGTYLFLKMLPSAEVLGYFHPVPPGLISSVPRRSRSILIVASYVGAHARPRGRFSWRDERFESSTDLYWNHSLPVPGGSVRVGLRMAVLKRRLSSRFAHLIVET
jgi:hypothetical protein